MGCDSFRLHRVAAISVPRSSSNGIIIAEITAIIIDTVHIIAAAEILMAVKSADSLTARGASLKKLADAADPLYGTLADRQRSELFQFLRTDFEKRHG
jgi:hypothetical protein